MTTNTALDSISEYLFRSCSVVTNLMTSLEIIPIRCATMLCLFGKTQKGSVAIHFILRGSAVTSSATGDYVTVPERFGQNEKQAGSNEERTRKKSSFVPKMDLTDALVLQTCNHDFSFILCIFDLFNIDDFLNVFLLKKILYSFVCAII